MSARRILLSPKLMQLFLVNNDPLDTLLVSQDGEPRYLIRSCIDTHIKIPNSFHLSSSPESYSSPESSSSAGSQSHSPSSDSDPTPDSHASASSAAPVPVAANDSSPSPYMGYRQRPAGIHTAIPIARTHSNPHPDTHKNWSDPSSPHPSPILPPSSPPSPSSTGPSTLVTNIKRLNRRSSNQGNVETEVGRVEYSGDEVGTRVQLCQLGMELCAPAVPKRRKSPNGNLDSTSLTAPAPSASTPVSRAVSTVTRRNDAGTALNAFRDFCTESQKRREPSTSSTSTGEPGWHSEEESVPDPTWSFKGPDNRPYKWISLASNPILVNDTTPPTPLACYRPAKLGIVSRSRRGFLEILPEGLEKEDWIVTTFAGYFRMKLGDRPPLPGTRISDSATAGLPIGMGMQANGGARKAISAPATPSASPLTQAPNHSPPKLSTSPSALATLEALRRMNKNYGYGSARRTW